MLQQAKVYLKSGEQPPRGVIVRTGKGGGRYYETSEQSVQQKRQPDVKGPVAAPRKALPKVTLFSTEEFLRDDDRVGTEMGSILDSEGDPIGTYRLEPSDDGAIYIHDIAIDEEHQGKGYGAAMLQAIEEKAAGRELKLIAAEIGVYAWARMGFEADDKQALVDVLTKGGVKNASVSMSTNQLSTLPGAKEAILTAGGKGFLMRMRKKPTPSNKETSSLGDAEQDVLKRNQMNPEAFSKLVDQLAKDPNGAALFKSRVGRLHPDDLDILRKYFATRQKGTSLQQAKVYLQPGQQAPKGVAVHKGKKGGSWYETTGKVAAPNDKKTIGKKQAPPSGKPAAHSFDQKTKDWLKSFGVSKYPPPGNTKPGTVQVHRNANPATQALMTWRDLNGKYQHSYSKQFHQNNAALKWKSVERYRPQVEKMRGVLNGDVKKSQPGSPEHQEAMVASIIAHTGLRPGNQLSASTGHFGVSTLQTQHVTFDGEGAHLEFIGKSGMLNKKTISDSTLVGGLKELVSQAKKEKRKNLFTVDVSNVRSILPKGMKLKTFRTIIATEEAERFLDNYPVKLSGNKGKDKKMVATALKEASTHVASQLNNTPAVAKSSYIHPNVFEAWLKKIGGEKLAD